MDQRLTKFRNIVEPRDQDWSNVAYMLREWNPVIANTKNGRVNPQTLKDNVLRTERINLIIEQICQNEKISRKEVEKTIRALLDEIGFNKQLHVIRALGLVIIKMLRRTSCGLHINEESISRVKLSMGRNPVIFIPSHRSYADFILMSYVCYHYDIEIPAIAAGMDFHGMWGMGSLLRDTGAFFMRRQFADDRLYANVFAQYVRELIVNGDTEIEFFIEGTRSRSCKSLSPKYGFLTMALKPFFFGEVPDITIIPISISYDRIMEERLFANELLGVPKPKESTSGFLKSLNIINEKFGDITFDFTSPISVKEYFGNRIDRTAHALGPLYGQTMSRMENDQIIDLAYHIVHTQQKHCVLMPFNLIALALNNSIVLGQDGISYNELIREITWLKSVMETLGATVRMLDPIEAISKALEVHGNLISRGNDNHVRLMCPPITFGPTNKKILKGHDLAERIMSAAVPLVQLMLYVNPSMHYFIGPAIATIIVRQIAPGREITKNELWQHYKWLRHLLAYEFVIHPSREMPEFEEALQYLDLLNIIESVNNHQMLVLGNHKKLQTLLCNCLAPFLITYKTVSNILIKSKSQLTEKEILAEAQKVLEEMLDDDKNDFIHPYSLSLDTISISLQSFASIGAVEKRRVNGKLLFVPNIEVLQEIVDKLVVTTPQKHDPGRELQRVSYALARASKL